MSTWIPELVGFAVIIAVIVWKVVPPVRKAMRKQQDLIRQQISAGEQAKQRLADAEQKYANAVAEARAEAAKIRDTARAEAEMIVEEMKTQARAEVERIKQRGQEQLLLERQQVIRELRVRIGRLSVELAGELVAEHLSDAGNRGATVDRFVSELADMAAPEDSGSRGKVVAAAAGRGEA